MNRLRTRKAKGIFLSTITATLVIASTVVQAMDVETSMSKDTHTKSVSSLPAQACSRAHWYSNKLADPSARIIEGKCIQFDKLKVGTNVVRYGKQCYLETTHLIGMEKFEVTDNYFIDLPSTNTSVKAIACS